MKRSVFAVAICAALAGCQGERAAKVETVRETCVATVAEAAQRIAGLPTGPARAEADAWIARYPVDAGCHVQRWRIPPDLEAQSSREGGWINFRLGDAAVDAGVRHRIDGVAVGVRVWTQPLRLPADIIATPPPMAQAKVADVGHGLTLHSWGNCERRANQPPFRGLEIHDAEDRVLATAMQRCRYPPDIEAGLIAGWHVGGRTSGRHRYEFSVAPGQALRLREIDAAVRERLECLMLEPAGSGCR